MKSRGEERAFAGLEVAVKMCLGQGQGHRLLPPQAAWDPRPGADNREPSARRVGEPTPQMAAQSLCVCLFSSLHRMRGQRP